MIRSLMASVYGMALLAFAGCGGGPPPVSTPEPLGVPVAVAEPVAEPQPEPREPDVAGRDRWGSPFAISAAGRVEPITPRRVTIIEADPAIAAGLAEQQAIQLNSASRAAGANNRPVATTDRAGDVPRIHRVERGDTWSAIAGRYRVPTRALADANPDVDPESIEVGQTLIIPRTD